MASPIFKYFYRLFVLVSATVIATVASAQLTSPSSASSSGITPIGTPEKNTLQLNTDAMVFQTAIDPKEYHMGPGDILQLELWTLNSSTNIGVSPDQVLIVPRIGEFNVKGKTLEQLRQEVYSKAGQVFLNRSKSLDQPVSLVLLQPRRIIVKVQGDVQTPGDYTLTATTRAHIAIDIANKATTDIANQLDPSDLRQQYRDQQQAKSLTPFLGRREANPASVRYATVLHSDGTRDRIDAVRYNTTHDPAASPLLREDDIIYVPLRDPQYGSIGVYGAVQSPGDFEFVSGDSLSSAIKYALGATLTADLHHVELTRLAPGTASSTTRSYDLSPGSVQDIALQAGDRIFVRGSVAKAKASVAYVRGEVAQAGVYPIEDGVTKLSEVIKEAGGFLPDAFFAGGSIMRRGYEQRFQAGSPEDIRLTSHLVNLSAGDTSNFQKQLQMRIPSVVVDMDRLFAKGDSNADIRLRDGDEITIPVRPTTIYVSGYVNNGGYLTYVPGARPEYYVEAAGGYAEGSQKSKARVIKVKTKAWMLFSDATMEPGDEIFVPKETDYSENYSIQLVAALASIAFAAINIALTLYNALRKP